MKPFKQIGEDKKKKGGNVCPFKRSKRFHSYLFLFLLCLAGIFCVQGRLVQSEPATFNQSDWSSGIPLDEASCAAAGGAWSDPACLALASGYKGYSSAQSGVVAGSDLKLGASRYTATLTSHDGAQDICDAPACNRGGGFLAGVVQNTFVNGTGAAASMQLAKVLSVDAFGNGGVVISDPSPRPDVITDLAIDANHVYLAGYDSFFSTATNNKEWRLEKRSNQNGNWEVFFNGSGIVTSQPSINDDYLQAIAIDGSYIYLAGDDFSEGNNRWRLEKWNLLTGDYAAGFGGVNGWFVTINPSTADDFLTDLIVDGAFLYVAGYDAGAGSYQWRVEKRHKDSGAWDNEFGEGGVLRMNPSSSADILNKMAMDDQYLYLVGADSSQGNYQWRLEKRYKSNGGPASFGAGGVITVNLSAGYDVINSVAIDDQYVYVAGFSSVGGSDLQWRIEKRNKTTGEMAAGFGTGGIIQSNPSLFLDEIKDIAVDGGYIYLAGYDSVPGVGNTQLRLEKRDINTGILDVNFDADGVFTKNPSSGEDSITSIVLDEMYIYAGGHDSVSGNKRMRLEKLAKVGGTYARSGVFTSPVIHLGNPYALESLSADAFVSQENVLGAGRQVSSTDNGLVAAWHFDVDTRSSGVPGVMSLSPGTIVVKSGSTPNDLSAIWSANGKLGSAAYNALSFTGNAYMLATLNGENIKTISFWVKDNANGSILNLGGATVSVTNGMIGVASFPDHSIYVNGSSGVSLSPGWNHVAVVSSSGTNVSGLYVGYGGAGYFTGSIDELALFANALTPYEVKRLYDGTGPIFQVAGSSTAAGPWDPINFVGPDGTPNSFFYWDPVGLWRADEASAGKSPDASGRGHDGTIGTVAINSVEKRLGTGAFQFNGTSDVVSVGDLAAHVRSVEFWIKVADPTTDTGDSVMELASTVNLVIEASTGQIKAQGFSSNPVIYVNGANSSPTLSSGWNHVVIVSDSAIYAQNVNFGKVYSDHLSGLLDEIVMYDRALTPPEVALRYNAGLGRAGAAVGGLVSASALQGKQYLRYKVFLQTGNGDFSPQMRDVTIGFSGFSSGATLTSSVFDSGSDANFLTGVSWTPMINDGSVRVQVATSADMVNWNYCGASACSAVNWLDFSASGNFITAVSGGLAPQMMDAVNDRYFRYRVALSSLGVTSAPVVNDIQINDDTARLEVFAPDGASTNYVPDAGVPFSVVLKAKNSSGDPLMHHEGAKTVLLTLSPSQTNTSCNPSFGIGTTYSSAVSFIDGEGQIPVKLCAEETAFTLSAQETSGGSLSSDSHVLTITRVNQPVSILQDADVNLSSNIAGVMTDAVVSFLAMSDLAAGDRVEIIFDSDFDLFNTGSVSGNLSATASAESNLLTITLGTAVSDGDLVSLTVLGVGNPDVPQTTSVYEIFTKTSAGTIIDEGEAPGTEIKAGFAFLSPVAGHEWAVNERKDIVWTTSGQVGQVDIFYATEANNYSNWVEVVSGCSQAAGGLCAAGRYAWTVEDILSNPQADPNLLMRFKIVDVDDGHPSAEGMSDIMTVKYYAVTWQIRDFYNAPVLGLDVNEPATDSPNKILWEVTDHSLNGNNIVRYYPYNAGEGDGAYTTIFSRMEGGVPYAISENSWRVDGNKTILLRMTTASAIRLKFNVNIDANYDSANDAINVVAWLTQDGKVVAKGSETGSLASITVDIFDAFGNKINTDNLGAGKAADAGGIFNGMSFDPAGGLNPNGSYTVKAVISHVGQDYTGLTSSIVPSRDTTVVKIGAVYDSATGRVNASVWLERGRRIIPKPGDFIFEVFDASGSAVETLNYDGYDSIDDAAKDPILVNGIYSGIIWAPASINAEDIYMLKARVSYLGKTYDSMEPFSKGELGALTTNIQNVRSQIATQTTVLQNDLVTGTGVVQNDLTVQTGEIIGELDNKFKGVEKDVGDLKAEVTTKAGDLENAAGKVSTESISSLPGVVAADVANQLAKGIQAEIVTRLTTAVSGTQISIRFRSVSGLAPVMRVYDPKNKLVLADTLMKEVPATGIYDYNLLLQKGWGVGDFTITVSEPKNQSVDSMVLAVTAQDTMSGGSGGSTAVSSGLTMDTLYTRLNRVNSNIDELMGHVATVNGTTGEISTDIDTLLRKSGEVSVQGGDSGAVTEYLDAVADMLNGQNGAPYETILGKLTGIESSLSAIGVETNLAVVYNANVQRQALMIARLAMMVKEKMGQGEYEEAEAGMETLNDELVVLQETIQNVPMGAITGKVQNSMDEVLGDLANVAEEKGLGDLVPMATADMREGGDPKNVLQMRNDISELKSLMMEVRGLLDQQVNQPIVHGWLEGNE